MGGYEQHGRTWGWENVVNQLYAFMGDAIIQFHVTFQGWGIQHSPEWVL